MFKSNKGVHESIPQYLINNTKMFVDSIFFFREGHLNSLNMTHKLINKKIKQG